MTALGTDTGLPPSLRMGERSAADAPLTNTTGQGTRPDAGAGLNGNLSGVNLTEHIQPTSRDPLFWRHVDMSGGPDACWPYNGARTKDGYGIVTRGPRGQQVTTTASRYAFIDAGGVVEDDEVVDHFKCDNPPCSNPAHLRAATQQVNILRGTSPSAHAATKTHCKNGHAFDLLNTGRKQGRRICLSCKEAAL